MAGLLACDHPHVFPVASNNLNCKKPIRSQPIVRPFTSDIIVQMKNIAYSSGTAQDSHLVPFSSPRREPIAL